MTDVDKSSRVRYDGPGSAVQVDDWCRNSALLPRFQPAKGDSPARVLVEPDEEMDDLSVSAQWVIVEPGDTLYRLKPRDDDSPLRITKAAEAAASAFTQEVGA